MYQVVTVDTPLGKVGLTICYDLRFPQLFRTLAQFRLRYRHSPLSVEVQTLP